MPYQPKPLTHRVDREIEYLQNLNGSGEEQDFVQRDYSYTVSLLQEQQKRINELEAQNVRTNEVA